MSADRRTFLKWSGLALFGLGVSPVSATLAAAPARYAKATGAKSARRWALVADMTKFNRPGIAQECIAACHRIHNVPTHPSRQNIFWIWQDTFPHAFPEEQHRYLPAAWKDRPVLLMCNHCDNPPCVRVCPTQATFRRESDGIVLMDYHRCIGCRYCMAACPYGARSFNFSDPRPYLSQLNPEYPTRTRGVVEKCDFCADRLDQGKAPACVEVSQGALIFGDLGDPESEVSRMLRRHNAMRRKPHLGTEPQVYYLL
jgi:molybdopterin-containing oxidoreductase family iron-sulfur binding subunit